MLLIDWYWVKLLYWLCIGDRVSATDLWRLEMCVPERIISMKVDFSSFLFKPYVVVGYDVIIHILCFMCFLFFRSWIFCIAYMFLNIISRHHYLRGKWECFPICISKLDKKKRCNNYKDVCKSSWKTMLVT